MQGLTISLDRGHLPSIAWNDEISEIWIWPTVYHKVIHYLYESAPIKEIDYNILHTTYILSLIKELESSMYGYLPPAPPHIPLNTFLAFSLLWSIGYRTTYVHVHVYVKYLFPTLYTQVETWKKFLIFIEYTCNKLPTSMLGTHSDDSGIRNLPRSNLAGELYDGETGQSSVDEVLTSWSVWMVHKSRCLRVILTPPIACGYEHNIE